MAGKRTQDRREWVLRALQTYECRLVRYAARLLSDEDAARDVVQHAFLRLCDQRPEQIDGRLAAWLFTVCRNRAMDLLRRNGRYQRLDDEAAGGCIGNEPDPAELAEARDVKRTLSKLVAQLPPSQREAVDLWSEGFDYRQIGEITNRTAGSVRVQVHRALKALRTHAELRPFFDEGADVGEQPISNRFREARHGHPTKRVP